MDISSLQVPKTGRSRFSKALPTPPPGLHNLDDRPKTASRDLPALPPAPLPPKKNSILIKSSSYMSLGTKSVNSPLPVLPIMTEAPRPRMPAGPISRKPVGHSTTTSPTTTSPTDASPHVHIDTMTKALRHMSSISSLLSAYSWSSVDSAHKSSHESDFTKDSEPSYSPAREGMDVVPPVPTKTSLVEITNDLYSDRASEVTSYTIIDSFPPPPPLNNPSRPHTPSTTPPLDPVRDGEGGPAGSASPTTSLGSGSPHGGREIWRRRASTRSDSSLHIPELKFPGSNGSTASSAHTPAADTQTTETPAVKAEKLCLPPPPLPKPSHEPSLPLPSRPSDSSSSSQQSTITLPPRTTSFPGKNIRPVREAKPSLEEDEMKKIMKFSKLKELVRRRHGDDEDDSDDVEKDDEVNKPKPPAKDDQMQDAAPTPPPKEPSPVPTVTQIPRRPVGTQPAPSSIQSTLPVLPALPPSQPELKLQFPAQSSNTIQPIRNPVGSLPHPSQRQRQRPSQSSIQYNPGPTSPTRIQSQHPMPPFGRPRGSSAATITESDRAPGLAGVSNHGPSGGRADAAERGLLVRPPRTTSIGNNQPSLVLPAAVDNVGGEVEEETREPMSAASMSAVGLFPRQQNWNVGVGPDGVQPSLPLNQSKYNCRTNHARFLPSPNTNVPLTCQTCGVPDREPRVRCTHCYLRICLSCKNMLIANGRDLKATMEMLKSQGKDRDSRQPHDKGT